MKKCPRCGYLTLCVANDEEWCERCLYVNRKDFWEEPLPLPYRTSFDAVRESLAPSLTRFMEDTDPSLSGRLDE